MSVGLLFAFFYIVVVSWSVWYLAASIGLDLEWAHCGHEYNTDDCYEIATNSTGAVGKSSAEQYWERYVLGSEGRGWEDFVSEINQSFRATTADSLLVAYRAPRACNPSSLCSARGSWSPPASSAASGLPGAWSTSPRTV